MDDLIVDFLAETREMLEALGGELVSWEEFPDDRARLDTIFRFFHTVKGNCGFFDFPRLEALSHAAEDVLADVRAGRRMPDSALVSAVLGIVDRIGEMVDAIEAGGELAEADDAALIEALEPQSDVPVEILHALAPDSDADQRKALAARRSVRLPVELLDRVMSGVSDMVLARNELARRLRETSSEAALHEPFERLSAIIADVRDAMTRTRMQPLEGLFASLPRLVRDLSGELGKQTLLDMEGSEVELDREMIEIIRNPLTHIIRNAIDHGLERPKDRLACGKHEAGLLSIAARQSGNQILIDIVDDGRGIDDARLVEKALANGLIDAARASQMSRAERISLIFEPGISTADSVSAISGRGVGMDVVRAGIERVGGALEIDSTPGEGTRVSLRVPLTLTIIPALTVSVGGQRFALPRSAVEEIVTVGSDAVSMSRNGGALLVGIRDERLPGLVLADVLGLDDTADDGDRNLVVLRLSEGRMFALAVDRLHGHEDLVVKPAAPAIIATGLYAGTTLTDDGHPILLLEVAGLARIGGLQFEPVERGEHEAAHTCAEREARLTKVLLFVGLDGRRKAISMAVVDRLEEVPASAIERDGHRRLVVIGERILPLAGMGQSEPDSETLRLFRLSDGQGEVAYAIGSALGVRQVGLRLAAADADADAQGFVLIDDEPTLLLSPFKLFAAHAAVGGGEAAPGCHLASDDPWLQNFVRPMVEAAGYRIARPGEEGVDLAIMTEDGEATPVSARKVIRLRSSPDPRTEDADAIYRYDHAGLLTALRSASAGRSA